MMKQSVQLKTAGAWGANVIPFVRPEPAAARLSMRDRMDVADWREPASRLGFDRLVIHERGSFDPPDVDNFLSVYRRGDSWASWTLVRRGAWVMAWSSASGADAGRFACVSDALRTLLITV
jgi:hypothetical protein